MKIYLSYMQINLQVIIELMVNCYFYFLKVKTACSVKYYSYPVNKFKLILIVDMRKVCLLLKFLS